MKYIVSVVMTKVIPAAVNPLMLNGSQKSNLPDISIQNVVGVCTADGPEQAYARISANARQQHPDHHISVKVVIESNAADLDINE